MQCQSAEDGEKIVQRAEIIASGGQTGARELNLISQIHAN
jgi:hypothetical protein